MAKRVSLLPADGRTARTGHTQIGSALRHRPNRGRSVRGTPL